MTFNFQRLLALFVQLALLQGAYGVSIDFEIDSSDENLILLECIDIDNGLPSSDAFFDFINPLTNTLQQRKVPASGCSQVRYKVTPATEANLRCIIGDVASETLSIAALPPLSFPEDPVIVATFRDQPAQLTCPLELGSLRNTLTPYSIMWTEGVAFPEPVMAPDQLSQENTVLTVVPRNSTDVQSFKCILNLRRCSRKIRCAERMHFGPLMELHVLEPSRLVVTPDSQEVESGETATFQCTGAGSYVVITWIFNNSLICNSERCDSSLLSYYEQVVGSNSSSNNLTIHSTLTVNTLEFFSSGQRTGLVVSVECRVEQVIPLFLNLEGKNSSSFTNLSIIAESSLEFEQPVYEVAEDIGENNFALQVCLQVSGTLRSPRKIALLTSDFSATGGEDYVPFSGEVTVGGARRRGCIAVIILEDEQVEDDETFLVSAVGFKNTTTTILILNDDDDVSFSFTGNSPIVSGNNVTFLLSLGSGVRRALCAVLVGNQTLAQFDCSNGEVVFTNLPNRFVELTPWIEIFGQHGKRSFVLRSAERNFRLVIGSRRRCSVHLVNEGISRINATHVAIEWGLSRPADIVEAHITFKCSLNGGPMFESGTVSIPENVTVDENGGTVTVCATLSASTAQNLTFTLSTMDGEGSGGGSGDGGNTILTTAQEGLDYHSASVTSTFPAESLTGDTRCLNITIIDDDIREREETFTVSLTTSDPAVVTGNTRTVITIVDDMDPTLMLNITSSSSSSSVLLGDYITLTCVASSNLTEDTVYNWNHSNTSSSRVLGETSNTLTLPHFSADQLGVYTCDVPALLTTGPAEINITSARPLINEGHYESRRTDVGACPSPSVRDDITVDILQLLSAQYGVRPLGLVQSYPADSCEQIMQANPDSRTGSYWIRDGEQLSQMICTF